MLTMKHACNGLLPPGTGKPKLSPHRAGNQENEPMRAAVMADGGYQPAMSVAIIILWIKGSLFQGGASARMVVPAKLLVSNAIIHHR